jgi:LPXTG-motif cell wall-anchored protein
MVKRILVLAVALVGFMAAPAMAQQYPPGENLITVSDTAPCPGDAVSVSAKTFQAGGAVTVKLDDSVVGTPTADANGVVELRITIPAGQAQGAVAITATGPGADGEVALTASVDVTACNETPATTVPAGGGGAGGGGSDLPRTGSDSTMTLVRVGVAMAAIGGVLLAVASKRRRRTAPVAA